jgi:hypothetical protein
MRDKCRKLGIFDWHCWHEIDKQDEVDSECLKHRKTGNLAVTYECCRCLSQKVRSEDPYTDRFW